MLFLDPLQLPNHLSHPIIGSSSAPLDHPAASIAIVIVAIAPAVTLVATLEELKRFVEPGERGEGLVRSSRMCFSSLYWFLVFMWTWALESGSLGSCCTTMRCQVAVRFNYNVAGAPSTDLIPYSRVDDEKVPRTATPP